ncbi:MAG: hypothetical protein M1826_003891 [Phylliscum demangeonii]|nr:MAG: hypothetical protein M1826_003891 [Phylliscum demangeonii]
MVARAINLGLRGLQFFWTLLIMALVGNMLNETINGSPSAINYTMFVSVFAMLSLFYLIAASIREELAFHPLIMLVLDVINTILFFIAAVVMAARLHVHSCGNTNYLIHNSITNGGRNMGKRCHEAQAVTAFLWFGFLTFLASTVLSAISSMRGGGRSSVRAGGIRRGGPSMSSV